MGRKATKRIHYVRAVYNKDNAPSRTFSDMVRDVITRTPHMKDTEVVTQSLGTIAIREKNQKWQDSSVPILLALGAGAANENMSTMGIGLPAEIDQDTASQPPHQRAFKTADAFVLIDGNELLICTDGTMRGYRSIGYYLECLFEKFSLDPIEQAFELHPRSNQGSVDTVTREGVKCIELSGVLYRASDTALKKDSKAGVMLDRMANDFQGWLEGSLPQKQQDLVADQWAEMNITTTVKPRGGKKAEPALLESLKQASLDMFDELPGAFDITIVTKKGNRVTPVDVTLSKTFHMHRRKARNDLATVDIWRELEKYRDELIDLKAWRK